MRERQEDGTGLTALHYACRKGDAMALAVLSLIDAGADASLVRPHPDRLQRMAGAAGPTVRTAGSRAATRAAAAARAAARSGPGLAGGRAGGLHAKRVGSGGGGVGGGWGG